MEESFRVQKEFFERAELDVKTIIDVGAYDGRTSVVYRELFPSAEIMSIEPYMNSFDKMYLRFKNDPKIFCYNLALSNKNCVKELIINSYDATNSFLPSDTFGEIVWGEGLLNKVNSQKIQCYTLSKFIKKMKIGQIDILKMDTQGTEYDILSGSKSLFLKGYVKMVYLEIITLPTYYGQKQLDQILKLMRDLKFILVGFYNESYKENSLRQLDALFICDAYKNDFMSFYKKT